MSLIQKIKLLFAAAKPAQQVAGEIKKIGAGWKSISFWVSLLGSLLALVGAVAGFVPASVSLIVTTVLTMFYNILRAVQQAGQPGVDPIFQSTRFWMGILGIISASLVSLQAGGVNPAWAQTAIGLIGAIMAGAQSLGAQQPQTPGIPGK